MISGLSRMQSLVGRFKIQDGSQLWPIEGINITSIENESINDSSYKTCLCYINTTWRYLLPI